MNNKKYTYTFLSLAILTILIVAVPAFADTTPTNTSPNGMTGRGRMFNNANGIKPIVFGTVSAISVNTLTVSGKQSFSKDATTSTFTVDASSAKIMKNRTTSTVAGIAVGDMVMIEGTLSGTDIAATVIRDGVINNNQGKGQGQAISSIVGNGQPVVLGTVSTISGSTLTITNKSNVSYTVDASNAKITKGQNAAMSLSDVTVGDMVMVQGTVNGNSIVASSVIDQNNTATNTTTNQVHKGFLNGIGVFFKHLFGF